MSGQPGWVQKFLSGEDLDAITHAVGAAEAGTSGEIRIHLDASCGGDPMARAVAVFEALGMHRTARRNGVLVYVAIEDRKLAVIGDAAIERRVDAQYWGALRDTLVEHFRAGRPRQGLIAILDAVGETLRRRFPREGEDLNELSDEVSLG